MNIAQRKALEYLAQTPFGWQPIHHIPNGRGYTVPSGATSKTLKSLWNGGQIEINWRQWPTTARITDAGLAALKENTL